MFVCVIETKKSEEKKQKRKNQLSFLQNSKILFFSSTPAAVSLSLFLYPHLLYSSTCCACHGAAPFHASTPNSSSTSAEKTNGNDLTNTGMPTLASGISRKSRLSASFSAAEHSLALKAGTVNIQMDHMPIRRAIEGSSEGKTRLKESRPPTATESQAWTPKMS